MERMIKKYLNSKSILVLSLLGTLSPFLVLAFFNHPCADDFEYTNRSITLGFWQTQLKYYFSWSGRYFSTALLSINPLVFRSFFLYNLFAVVLFAALLHGFYLLMREMGEGIIDRTKTFIAALMLLTVYVYAMPSVSAGFYWIAGSITYQVANILTVYLFLLTARIYRASLIKTLVLNIVLSFLAIIAIVGSNETSMILLLLLFFAMLTASLFVNRKMDWVLFAFIIVTAIAAYFVVFAPGNTVRLSYYPHKQSILFALKHSIADGFKSIWHWGVSLPMAASTVLFIPIASQLAIRRISTGKRTYIHPFFSCLVIAVFLVAGFFPAYWSMGESPPPRTANVIHLFFLIGWFISVYALVEFLIRNNKLKFEALPRYLSVILWIFIFLSFFKSDNNIRTAFDDLYSGRAQRYHQQFSKRYQVIAEDRSGMCIVDRLRQFPATLYFDDIVDDPTDWKNRDYAQYFHKKSIVIRK